MKYSLVFAALAAVIGMAQGDQDHDLHERFINWRSEHSKNYGTVEEYNHAFGNFKDNILRVRDLNAEVIQNQPDDPNRAVFKLTKFADLSPEEFSEQYLIKDKYRFDTNNKTEVVMETDTWDEVTSFDWYNKKFYFKTF